MSDFGLNVSLYDVIRKYSDLIDEVLLDLKSRTDSSDDNARKELAEFLAKLADKETMEFDIKLISTILNRDLKWSINTDLAFKDLSARLRNQQANSDDIAQLENIAMVLDNECIQTLSRVRGVR